MIRSTQMLIFFGALCLISIIGVASFTDENLSHNQTSQCIQPINYTISFKIQDSRLIGRSNVVLNFSCEQKSISLPLSRHCYITEKVDYRFQSSISYDLKSAKWDAEPLITPGNRYKSVVVRLIEDNKRYTDLRKKYERRVLLKSGLYTFEFKYNCILSKIVDTYRSQTKTKEFPIVSRIPNEWIFPYWKNPATKARFTIQIEHKNTDTVLTNMPINYKTVGNHFSTNRTVFFTTPLISTHLVAFIVIPNEYKTSNTTNSSVTITNSLKMRNDIYSAQTLIRNITNRIRNVWNDIVPRSNVSYVLLPITSTHYETIVTPGFVFLSEFNSIYDSEIDSIIKERQVTCFIARNVLQEIFSDWLPTFEQSDPWFLEGFLTVYGIYILDKSLVKPFVVQTRRNILDYIEAFNKNDFPIQGNLSINQNSILRKMWREKGFSTFYMLNIFARDILYDFMFKKVAHSYYINDNTSTNAYNKLSILDKLWYWNFEASITKSTYFSATQMKKIITSWTTQVGYFVLQVNRHINKQNLTLKINDCFDVDHKKPCKEKWWIPVTLYQLQESKIIARSFTSLDPDNQSISIGLINENVVAIVDSSGYRVNYDRQSWKDIAFFLKTVDSRIAYLSDVTVAQILDDAFYFLVQNRQYTESSGSNMKSNTEDIFLNDLYIYLELAGSIFHVDSSYTAWYPVFRALEIMSKIFPYPDRFVSITKEKLLELLNKFSDDISYTHSSKNTVNNQFYHEVLKWTCILNGSKCKDHVEKIWHFESSAHNKSLLLPSWQKWIYCRKLKLETYEDSTVMLPLFNLYWRQKKEKEFFELVSCFKQFENGPSFLRFLDQIFSLQTYILNESFTVRLLFNIVASYSNNKSILPIILSGKYLGSKLGIKVVSEMTNLALVNCIINNIYSEDILSMINNDEFLNEFLDIKNMEPFVLDVIKKKVENRRGYLFKMQHIRQFTPWLIFNY